MMKLAIFGILTILLAGGSFSIEAQNQNDSSSADKIKAQISDEKRNRILKHLQEKFPLQDGVFSLAPEKVIIDKLKIKEVPGALEHFLVMGEGFSHWAVSYLFYQNELYCSENDGDFARFLKDYGFLTKKPNVEMFLELESIFKRKIGYTPNPLYVLSGENLEKWSRKNKNLRPPRANKLKNGGIEVVYFQGSTFSNDGKSAPEKVSVNISPNYELKYTVEKTQN